MPFSKQAININFAQGLDTKTDPWQVAPGKFLSLENSIFTKGGLLQKRNGYQEFSTLPNDTFSYITTLNDNLTALGYSVAAYAAGPETWVNKGSIEPMQVSTLPLIRNNVNQTQCDAAIAPNGLVCTVYTQNNSGTTQYLYVIADSVTGQNIVEPTMLPVVSGAVTGSPRVFLVGFVFVIVYTVTISGTHHLQYIAIPYNNPNYPPTTNQDIAVSYTPSNALSWDGAVFDNVLYISYYTTSGGSAIKVTYLTAAAASAGQTPATPASFPGTATLMSVTVDGTNPTVPIIYVSYYNSGSSDGFTLAVYSNLATRFTPQATITATTVDNLASAAQNGVCTLFYEVDNNYGYDATIPTHYINAVTVSSAGVVGTPYTVVRSVGLASKAFIINGTIYILSTYQSPYQPTYFLINGSESTEAAPIVAAKLAYENGGGPYAAGSAYLPLGLPNVTLIGTEASVPYLYKDLIEALSNANAAGTSTVGGIYSQTGINLGTFDFTTVGTDSAEIGEVLQFSGGFLWMYDGYLPVEHNFFLWPDSVETTTATTGGFITAGTYFYQAVYEWSDNQGNIYRSAGSIPVEQVVPSGTSTNANTVYVPTLRLTYKVANPVKITIYRYSAAQEVWYEITSITVPILNSTTTDYITYLDTQADSAISGNAILYTTGGVVEDINAPATNIMTLFDTRFWMVDAEDPNLLWFSKQVIENTPVEMSDLFTFYIAPSTAVQGSTGPITALCPMDDKLIIFKKDAMYYINGTGPDNTGANNAYSQPIFITSVVGCANQQSIVFMPQGLMFQSDKGIWLLGRDLSTNYIGAPVEEFNSSTVQSAVNVPETNQCRFTLNTGQTLMYDYFYGQWGTFVGVPAISACIYEGLHTFINSFGAAYQESPDLYLDGSNPVLMSFITSWFNLAGLQGYQRAYFFYLLGQYLTPHKLQLGIAYNYNPAVTQSTLISPDNFSSGFGDAPAQSPFGQQTPMGGGSSDGLGAVERWRVFLAQQRCQAFQLILQEVYDPSFGIPAGAGLTLSGINLVTGMNRGFRPTSAGHTVGGGSNTGAG
jgi:hypothetical protein